MFTLIIIMLNFTNVWICLACSIQPNPRCFAASLLFAVSTFNPAKEVVRGPSSWLIQDKNRQSQNNRRKETHITYTKILPMHFEWNCDHWAIQLYRISAYKISVAIQYLKTVSWQRPQPIKIIPRNQLHQHHSTFKIPQHVRSPGFVLPCIEDYIIQHF